MHWSVVYFKKSFLIHFLIHFTKDWNKFYFKSLLTLARLLNFLGDRLELLPTVFVLQNRIIHTINLRLTCTARSARWCTAKKRSMWEYVKNHLAIKRTTRRLKLLTFIFRKNYYVTFYAWFCSKLRYCSVSGSSTLLSFDLNDSNYAYKMTQGISNVPDVQNLQ